MPVVKNLNIGKEGNSAKLIFNFAFSIVVFYSMANYYQSGVTIFYVTELLPFVIIVTAYEPTINNINMYFNKLNNSPR